MGDYFSLSHPPKHLRILKKLQYTGLFLSLLYLLMT
ncbi:hypothetical protein GBAR_LOCUS6255, partial [Geodia barretti]